MAQEFVLGHEAREVHLPARAAREALEARAQGAVAGDDEPHVLPLLGCEAEAANELAHPHPGHEAAGGEHHELAPLPAQVGPHGLAVGRGAEVAGVHAPGDHVHALVPQPGHHLGQQVAGVAARTRDGVGAEHGGPLLACAAPRGVACG